MTVIGQNSRKIVILFLSLYVVTAHIILPQFNDRKDFFIFAAWDMYSTLPVKAVVDLTWDEGRTYLLRDHSAALKKNGVKLGPLYSDLQKMNGEEFKANYLSAILNFCQCTKVEMVQLEGSRSRHILFRSEPITLKTISL